MSQWPARPRAKEKKQLEEDVAALKAAQLDPKLFVSFTKNDDFRGWWFGTFFIFHILGIIIPTDFHIFQRVGQPPTSLVVI